MRGAPLCHGARYTMAFERGDGIPAEVMALGPVFAGHTQVVADMMTDARFAEAPALRANIVKAGLRARLAVPLSTGGRVRGAFVVMSGTPASTPTPMYRRAGGSPTSSRPSSRPWSSCTVSATFASA